MRFQYAGPGPDESSGELIRPGDVREYDAAPDWGPWELLDGPDSEPARRPTDVEAGLITAEQKALSSDQGLDAPAPQWPAVTPEGNK